MIKRDILPPRLKEFFESEAFLRGRKLARELLSSGEQNNDNVRINRARIDEIDRARDLSV